MIDGRENDETIGVVRIKAKTGKIACRRGHADIRFAERDVREKLRCARKMRKRHRQIGVRLHKSAEVYRQNAHHGVDVRRDPKRRIRAAQMFGFAHERLGFKHHPARPANESCARGRRADAVRASLEKANPQARLDCREPAARRAHGHVNALGGFADIAAAVNRNDELEILVVEVKHR